MAVNSSRESDLADEDQEFHGCTRLCAMRGGGGKENDDAPFDAVYPSKEARDEARAAFGPLCHNYAEMVNLRQSVQPPFSLRTAGSTGDGARYVATSRGAVATVARSPAQAVYAMPESGRQIASLQLRLRW